MEWMASPEASSRSAAQETSCFMWNCRAHCLVHNSPPLDNIVGQMNPVDILLIYCVKIHFNVILQ
jgi:hypothetical protein